MKELIHEKRNINFCLNETVHSSFSLMGHFSKSPKTKDILGGSTGTLNYHDRIAEVKMTPELTYTFGDDGANFTVSNERRLYNLWMFRRRNIC
ncbi:hypothetical protein EFM11_10170 [Lactobacillus helveticus]|nr:hypothetical protein [Lactobacillus helveticus]MCT0165630.1 hypothetical protein [Lactobacillus helveticus]